MCLLMSGRFQGSQPLMRQHSACWCMHRVWEAEAIRLRIREDALSVGNDETSVVINYFTPIPEPPVWQPSSALQSSLDALETRRINVASLVSLANKIEAVGGLQEWLDFDGTDLIVTRSSDRTQGYRVQNHTEGNKR